MTSNISHYPQDDAIIEMCDKLGMLAWEEIPVIDIVPDTPGYGDNCERSLREMIRQHSQLVTHLYESVVLWIMGNSDEVGSHLFH